VAKKAIKEKDLIEFLHSAGCREITKEDKRAEWYKKAAQEPPCLKMACKQKIHQ
jgi:hypothetical protein